MKPRRHFFVILLVTSGLLFLFQPSVIAQEQLESAVKTCHVGMGIDCNMEATVSAGHVPTPEAADSGISPEESGKVISHLKSLQIPFILNQGQMDKGVKFYAKTFGGTLFVTDKGEIVYSLSKLDEDGPSPSRGATLSSPTEDVNSPSPLRGEGKGEGVSPEGKIDVRQAHSLAIKEELIGAKVSGVKGEGEVATRVSYFKGNNPSKWKSGIPTYESVSFGEVYEGIGLSLKAYGNNVEKLFHVNPGANPADIKVKLNGAKGIRVNKEGELEVLTELGPVKFTKPVAYQENGGKKEYVEVVYHVDEITYGFTLGDYDKSYPLIIDPLLASTFIGGGGLFWGELVYSLIRDSTGNIYVTGKTPSSDYPVTPGAYDITYNDDTNIGDYWDIFVSKFNSNLSTLLASTFIGGSNVDVANSIAKDNSGNIYIAGYTYSTDYPTTPGVYNSTSHCIFVSKLDDSLTNLLASTFLGGSCGYSDGEYVASLAIDNSGNVYLAGHSTANYPTTPGAYDTTYNGGGDVFVSKLDANLSTLLASTFIGGSNDDRAYSIAIDSLGKVYVAGGTFSTDYPATTGSYDTTHNGYSDVFASKFEANLSTLLASTFIGGSSYDYYYTSYTYQAIPLIIDALGNIYVAGSTGSSDYPTTPGTYDSSVSYIDVFVSKLSYDLTTLLASTFIGGGYLDEASSLAVDSSGNIYVAGHTYSEDYPTTPGAYDRSASYFDVFVSKFSGNLSALLASTLIGGSAAEMAPSLAVDNSSGSIYVAGYTSSSDYYTTPVAYDTTYNGGAQDIFISMLTWDLTQNVPADSDGDGLPDAWEVQYGLNPLDATGNNGASGDPDGDTFTNLEEYLHGSNPIDSTSVPILDTWRQINVSGEVVCSVATDSQNVATLYAGTCEDFFGGEVYKTLDGGAIWSSNQPIPGFTNVSSVSIDALTPSDVYAGHNCYGVSKSTDGGISWTQVNNSLCVIDLAIDPAIPNSTVYAAGYVWSGNDGIFVPRIEKSTTGGTTWENASTGLPGPGVEDEGLIWSIEIDPQNPNTLYTGTGQGVFKSTNGGDSWGPVNNGLTNLLVSTLDIDPQSTNTLYAGTDQGVFKSTNGGDSWSACSSGLGLQPVLDLAINPQNPNTLYAATYNGVYRTTNGCGSWSPVNNGLTNLRVYSLAINPQSPRTLYAGTDGDGVFVIILSIVPKPDLIMTALSTTTAIITPGSSVSLSNTVKNQGNASASSFGIAFHLSTDAVYGGTNDIAFTTTRSVSSLGGGASSGASTSVTVPSTTPLGSYYICSKADSGGAVSESNETNNTRCTTSTINVTKPDLVMTAVTPGASTVNAGATLSVTNTAKNQGGLSAGSFTIAFRLSKNTTYGDSDDVSISATRSVSSLAAGASSSATTNLTIPSTTKAGSYYVCAKADSGSAITESIENNNTLCSSTQVTVPKPDLIMTALSTTTTAIKPGNSLSLSNTVKNQGGTSAGSFAIAFHLSVDAVYGGTDDRAFSTTRSVSSLGVGASSSASTPVTVPSTTPLGTYYICSKADNGGTVSESNETNNTRCTTSTINVTKPDLVMTAVTPGTTTVNAGSTLSVTNTVKNQGGISAGSFTIAFRLSKNTTYGDSDDVSISATRSVSSLAAGASSTATTGLTIPSTTKAGSYYVCTKADSGSAIAESNENNNILCSSTQVTVPSPDLITSALSTAATTVSRGGSFSLSNTAKNQGGSSAGSFTIAFHLSVDAVYGGTDDKAFSTTRSVSSLGVGASNSASTSLTVSSTTPVGNYYVCAKADSGSTVSEGTNESNNTRCTAAIINVQ